MEARKARFRALGPLFDVDDTQGIAIRLKCRHQVGTDVAGSTEQENRRSLAVEVAFNDLVDGAQQGTSGRGARIRYDETAGVDPVSRDETGQYASQGHLGRPDQTLDKTQPP